MSRSYRAVACSSEALSTLDGSIPSSTCYLHNQIHRVSVEVTGEAVKAALVFVDGGRWGVVLVDGAARLAPTAAVGADGFAAQLLQHGDDVRLGDRLHTRSQ